MPEFSLGAALATTLIGGVAGYLGSILNQDRIRRIERLTFLRALEAEVSILQEKLIAWNDYLRRCIEKEPTFANEGLWEVTDRDMLIFTTNTSKIGLFDHELAAAIIYFYHNAHIARMRLDAWHKCTTEERDGGGHEHTREAYSTR